MVNSLQKRVRAEAAEVARLEGVVAQWEAEGAAKRAELADLEARIGDEILADESRADGLTDAATRLRSRIDVADRTARAAGRQLAAPRGALARAQAGEKRAEAVRLRAQAEAHEAAVDRAVTALKALDPLAQVELYRPPAEDRAKARADQVLGIVSPYDVTPRLAHIQAHHAADVLLEEADALDRSAGEQSIALASTSH